MYALSSTPIRSASSRSTSATEFARRGRAPPREIDDAVRRTDTPINRVTCTSAPSTAMEAFGTRFGRPTAVGRSPSGMCSLKRAWWGRILELARRRLLLARPINRVTCTSAPSTAMEAFGTRFGRPTAVGRSPSGTCKQQLDRAGRGAGYFSRIARAKRFGWRSGAQTASSRKTR